MCVCVCCDIYTCVKWRFFSPSKKKGRLNAKHNTCHTFSQIFHLNLSLFVCSKKREKKNRESKKRWIFSRILHLFVSHYVIIYYVELFSLCAYTIKRGLGKREKTSAYKSNNNNKREREKERTVLIIRRIDQAEKSRAYTNDDDDDDDGSSSRRLWWWFNRVAKKHHTRATTTTTTTTTRSPTVVRGRGTDVFTARRRVFRKPTTTREFKTKAGGYHMRRQRSQLENFNSIVFESVLSGSESHPVQRWVGSDRSV